jgi:hypothetical protein
MRLTTLRLGRALFAAGVLTALGFGTANALPTSGAGEAGTTARFCDDYTCDRDCVRNGYLYGVCQWDGTCICYLLE